MSDLQLVEWMGATWSIGDEIHGEFRCVVVRTTPASGWHVGDHCWLTSQEIHPSSTNGKDTHP